MTFLNDQEDGEQADAERRFGKLGKARCLTASGKTDEAVKLAQAVIDKSDPDDNLLYAEASQHLRRGLAGGGRPRDGSEGQGHAANCDLLAVPARHVLYNEAPNAHAEALANLTELFTELRMSNHAAPAATRSWNATRPALGQAGPEPVKHLKVLGLGLGSWTMGP